MHLSKSSCSILSLRGFREASISFSGSALIRDYILVVIPVSMLALSLYCNDDVDSAPFITPSSNTFNTLEAICLACDLIAFLSDIFNRQEMFVQWKNYD